MISLFATRSRLLMNLRKTALENIMEKGENAGNQHFSTVSLFYEREELSLQQQLIYKCFQFGPVHKLSSGKVLNGAQVVKIVIERVENI